LEIRVSLKNTNKTVFVRRYCFGEEKKYWHHSKTECLAAAGCKNESPRCEHQSLKGRPRGTVTQNLRNGVEQKRSVQKMTKTVVGVAITTTGAKENYWGSRKNGR